MKYEGEWEKLATKKDVFAKNQLQAKSYFWKISRPKIFIAQNFNFEKTPVD